MKSDLPVTMPVKNAPLPKMYEPLMFAAVVTLPELLNVPVTFAPVPVITNTLATPTAKC